MQVILASLTRATSSSGNELFSSVRYYFSVINLLSSLLLAQIISLFPVSMQFICRFPVILEFFSPIFFDPGISANDLFLGLFNGYLYLKVLSDFLDRKFTRFSDSFIVSVFWITRHVVVLSSPKYSCYLRLEQFSDPSAVCDQRWARGRRSAKALAFKAPFLAL